MKVENIQTFGWSQAIKGIRNSYKVNDKSDSYMDTDGSFIIGEKDKLLIKALMKGAPERKFLRMLHIQAEVTAPLAWWKQEATYKIGTTENSESTMHTLLKETLSLDSFEAVRTDGCSSVLNAIIIFLNECISVYKTTEDKKSKKDLEHDIFMLLPDGFLQRRTIDLNYETCLQMLTWRMSHKLNEWHVFCKEMLTNLPYMSEFVTYAGIKIPDEYKELV